MVHKSLAVRRKVCNWFQYFACSYYQWQSFIPFSCLPLRVFLPISLVLGSWDCFIGVCFTSDSGTRNGNFSFQYISASRALAHAHICMYIMTLLEIATYADHMHNKLWWTGFPTKWKTNKSIVLQGGEGENIHSITNMRVRATIKGYNASKKKNKNKKRQKEIASKMF